MKGLSFKRNDMFRIKGPTGISVKLKEQAELL